MAFRVSWNALRDAAHAVGAGETAATLYPLVVDGLMALALVATLALTGKDRAFALRVLAGYTLASLALNYVHGLVPTMQAGQRMQLADWSCTGPGPSRPKQRPGPDPSLIQEGLFSETRRRTR